MPAKPKEQNPLATTQVNELVARRAYEIYEQRGHEQGRDTEHWLQAEQEILGLLTLEQHTADESELLRTIDSTRVKTVTG